MTKRFHKHKILLDENFYPRSKLPKLNQDFNIKHIKEDYNKAGLEDIDVYRLAVNLSRTIVTFNYEDFEELVLTKKGIGVIGVSANMSIEDIDKKLTALFRKSTKKSLLGKLTIISGESEI